jgi:hypothetical protein
MKVFTIVFAATALLLLLSMLLCGLWSKSKGLSEESAKKFHTKLGVTAMLFSIAAIILLLIQL